MPLPFIAGAILGSSVVLLYKNKAKIKKVLKDKINNIKCINELPIINKFKDTKNDN